MKTYIVILSIAGFVLGIYGIIEEETILVVVGCYAIIMARLYNIELKIDEL